MKKQNRKKERNIVSKFFSSVVDIVVLVAKDLFTTVGPVLIPGVIIAACFVGFFGPDRMEYDDMELGTGYSMSVDHYVGLNELGMCKEYSNFVKDYFLHKQSYRSRVKKYSGKPYEVFLTDISLRSKNALKNKTYGQYFQDFANEVDEMKIVNSGQYSDVETHLIVASNAQLSNGINKIHKYGSATQSGAYQPRLFADIERNRCLELDKHFNIFQSAYYNTKVFFKNL